ncbi:MAG: hypothetical protein ABL889_12600 [Terricaulis sp.]
MKSRVPHSKITVFDTRARRTPPKPALTFAVQAGRDELVRLHRAGEIDDKTLHDLEHDLDLEELGAIASKV